MEVGFIGLGHMGSGMAADLLRAGHRVTVWNRTASKTEALGKQGAAVAATIAGACGGEAVVTMLSNDEAVENVVFGPGGILASLPNGKLHISSSTISPPLADRLTKAHADAGRHAGPTRRAHLRSGSGPLRGILKRLRAKRTPARAKKCK